MGGFDVCMTGVWWDSWVSFDDGRTWISLSFLLFFHFSSTARYPSAHFSWDTGRDSYRLYTVYSNERNDTEPKQRYLLSNYMILGVLKTLHCMTF